MPTSAELGILALSLKVALVGLAASLPLAVAIAFLLARKDFPGKTLFDALVHLPLVLPPVVVGFGLLILFGTQGPVGRLLEPLGIVFTELGPDYLRGTMPVDARTHQPFGLLHGGASVALAETLGSTAGGLCVGPDEGVVGIEINANHLAGVREGLVTGTARPLHVGRSTQVWEIRIEDAEGRLACVSRLTLAVIRRR